VLSCPKTDTDFAVVVVGSVGGAGAPNEPKTLPLLLVNALKAFPVCCDCPTPEADPVDEAI